MSETQQIVTAQFLEAMGNMVEDREKVQHVLSFIQLLNKGIPCQLTKEDLRKYAMQSYHNAIAGQGLAHDEVKALAQSWKR